jgi:hypothetical protein
MKKYYIRELRARANASALAPSLLCSYSTYELLDFWTLLYLRQVCTDLESVISDFILTNNLD